MQINTQKTVEKTLAKYRWDDLENWQRVGNPSDGAFQRPIYQKGNMTVSQKKWPDGQGVVVETPEYTMYITMGRRLNAFYDKNKKQVQYYSLSVATTWSDKNIYQSTVDDAGYVQIQGNRQYLFHFMEDLPDRYFDLDVDEKAPHISTCWMRHDRPYRHFAHRFLDKERS